MPLELRKMLSQTEVLLLQLLTKTVQVRGQPVHQLANQQLRGPLLLLKLNQVMELRAQQQPIAKLDRVSVWQTKTALDLGQLALPLVKQLLRGLSLLLKLSKELESSAQLQRIVPQVKVTAKLRLIKLLRPITSVLEQLAPKRRNCLNCTTRLELIPNTSCSS